MKRLIRPFALCATAMALSLTSVAQAQQGSDLLAEYRCYVCHADHDWKAGPSFDAIATVYKRHPNASDELIAVIRRGQHGGGPWQMPPHPEVADGEARTMVRYILSLPRVQETVQ